MEHLRELLRKILVDQKDIYFVQEFKVLDNWANKRKGKSHYVIVQSFKSKGVVERSLCFGIELHDFDNDEIKEVLHDILCKGDEDGKQKTDN